MVGTRGGGVLPLYSSQGRGLGRGVSVAERLDAGHAIVENICISVHVWVSYKLLCPGFVCKMLSHFSRLKLLCTCVSVCVFED